MRLPTLLALSLILSACGGGDPKALVDEGVAAFNSGDADLAFAKLDAALAGLRPEDPEFVRASVTRCRALCRLDAARGKEDFLALARSRPDLVRDQDFAAVARELVSHGAITEAVEVAEIGMKTFPESPGMQSVRDLVGDAVKGADDPAALQRLKGLGYAGDG